MSDKFEQNIRQWYEKSQTRNLEYLDLAKNPEPTNLLLANNLEVVFDRVSLLSKVTLKHFFVLEEENLKLKSEISLLRDTVASLEREIINNRSPKLGEIKALIQPVLAEEEVLAKELRISVRKIEQVLQEVQDLKNQVNSLKGQTTAQVAGPSKDLEVAIDDLTKRIAGINLTEGSVIPKKKGAILVFKNPADILNNEKTR